MRLWQRRGVQHAEKYRCLGAAPGQRARGKTLRVTWCTPITLVKSKEPKRLTGSDQKVRGEDVRVCSRPIDRPDLHRGRGCPYGVCISSWRNTVNPMGGQVTDSTGCKAGQYPGGRGCGRKRRPSGHRRDRATRWGGETPPERVLTSHGSSRTRRRKGNGRHGPYGRAASGTERPWLSLHGLVPDWTPAARRVQSLRFRIFRAACVTAGQSA
jgi:hypothetical protein